MFPTDSKQDLKQILDHCLSQITSTPDSPGQSIQLLSRTLFDLRKQNQNNQWKKDIELCRNHPFRHLIHQDPLTYRAFSKPRGYQGDAELLDIIYEKSWHGIIEKNISKVGQAIFDYTINCSAPEAVRVRRVQLTKMLNEMCYRYNKPEILSVACGHLRELDQFMNCKQLPFGRFVGLDQDETSLASVNKRLSHLGVETLSKSIRHVLSGKATPDTFDFIYSAGLYDYLAPRLAQKLTMAMFKTVKPGGCLVIMNYLPDNEDVGFMEAYMDWNLIYRDKEDMLELASLIPDTEIKSKKAYKDITSTFVTVEIYKTEEECSS